MYDRFLVRVLGGVWRAAVAETLLIEWEIVLVVSSGKERFEVIAAVHM